jgi:hypothetical protein
MPLEYPMPNRQNVLKIKDEKLIKIFGTTQSLVTVCSCFHTVPYFSTYICGTTTGQTSGWIDMERDIQTLCGLSTHTVQTRRMERSDLKILNRVQMAQWNWISMSSFRLDNTMTQCLIIYKSLIDQGIAPEQARMVLPQSMMTEWYWSGTLYAFARVCNLRCAPDTQQETREVADQISAICAEHFPVCWRYLVTKI